MTAAIDGNGPSERRESSVHMDSRRCRYVPRSAWLLLTPLLLVYLVVRYPQAQPLVRQLAEQTRFLHNLPAPALRRQEIHGNEHELDRRLNIFGSDGRALVKNSSVFPYNAIGLLRWSDNVSCTASLVDDSYILTAAECVLDSLGNQLASTLAKPEFLPGYGNDPSVSGTTSDATTSSGAGAVAKAYVVRVHKQSDYWKKWTQNTYVLLELDQALGATRGVLLLPSLSDLDAPITSASVQCVGYDDKADDLSTAKMELEQCTCHFPSTFNGQKYMLHHDCDTSARGSPGSPLLVRYANLKTYILGLNTNAIGSDHAGRRDGSTGTYSSYSNNVANRAVLTPYILQQLQYLKQQDTGTSTASGSASATSSVADTSSSSITTTSSSSFSPGPTQAVMSSGSSNTAAPDAQQDPGSSANSHETSTTAGQARIPPVAAYVCIVFICFAWACIIFIAVRHIRHRSDTELRSEH